MQVIVDSRFRIPKADIDEVTADELKAAFTHKNPKHFILKRAQIRGWWKEPAEIKTWGEHAGCWTFPRGGGQRLREVLKKRGLVAQFVDQRSRSDAPAFPDYARALWAHQERLVTAGIAKENALLKAVTASGKTSACLALASVLKQRTLVIVHSQALMEQWVERAVAELGYRAADVGIVGDGKFKVRDLTIGIQKSVATAIGKDPAFAEGFGLVICDEVHLFAASTFFASTDPMSARYRIGVSDDAKRKDGKEFLVYDLFGQPVAEVKDDEVIDAGHVMQVEVMVVPTNFTADWYGQPPEDDKADKAPEFGRLLAEMSNDAERNAVVDRIVAAELVEGRQILVFAREREHCRVLGATAAQRTRAGFLVGGPDYKAEFARTRKGLKSGEIRVAVGTYQACGTGIDLPGVEIGIAVAPLLANKQIFRQARGRVCRKPAGKTTARLYVLWDKSVFGIRHLENAIRWGGKENTFVWDEGTGSWLPGKEWMRAHASVSGRSSGK